MAKSTLRADSACSNVIPLASYLHAARGFDPGNPSHVSAWQHLQEMGVRARQRLVAERCPNSPRPPKCKPTLRIVGGSEFRPC